MVSISDLNMAVGWLEEYDEGCAGRDECLRVAEYLKKEIERRERSAALASAVGDCVRKDPFGGWNCVVNGREFGSWPTKAAAKAGLVVELRRRMARADKEAQDGFDIR
jgi:hypothetical protein